MEDRCRSTGRSRRTVTFSTALITRARKSSHAISSFLPLPSSSASPRSVWQWLIVQSHWLMVVVWLDYIYIWRGLHTCIFMLNLIYNNTSCGMSFLFLKLWLCWRLRRVCTTCSRMLLSLSPTRRLSTCPSGSFQRRSRQLSRYVCVCLLVTEYHFIIERW